jgi:putative ABC transport system substrate-binding protein
MRRREFLGVLGGAAAWPLRANAQQDGLRRVGVLMGNAESDPQGQSEIGAFRQGLQRLGWTGRNVRIAYRWADGEVDRMRTFARGLIGLQPDAVLAISTPAVNALVRETRTIPIVFVRVADPLGDGVVDSMAKPGGNVTGFSTLEPTIAGKWLQLLKKIAPGVTHVTRPKDDFAPDGAGGRAATRPVGQAAARDRCDFRQLVEPSSHDIGCGGPVP